MERSALASSSLIGVGLRGGANVAPRLTDPNEDRGASEDSLAFTH